jgi:hypothetical protein
MAKTTFPQTKWQIAHSGFANTPFVIFAGSKAPDFNSQHPLQGVEVIAEVPQDEGPRHLTQERYAKMIAATMDMYTRLRQIRSELEGYSVKSDIDVTKLHELADGGISLAEGR